MIFFILLAGLVPIGGTENCSKNCDQAHPDVGLNIYEFMDKYGYPLEMYNVRTEDNYILGVHRIPHGKNHKDRTLNRPVVLLMHGLLSSTNSWLIMGPNKSLPLRLADLGYDVWLGNARGNTFSRNHTTLNPNKDMVFWDFSLDDIALYDIPATVDYILNVTGQKQLSYVGHSQGTTVFFAWASSVSDYNEKINIMVALAPVTYTTNISNIIVDFLFSSPGVVKLTHMLAKQAQTYEFLPHLKIIETFGDQACRNGSIFQYICSKIFESISGYSSQIDTGFIPVIATYEPSGCSFKQIEHFIQLSDQFQHFNFGTSKNIRKYGTRSPPIYNLHNVKLPVAVYYSEKDILARKENVEKLLSELPNVVYVYVNPLDEFSHLDYLWATDVNKLLYNDVIRLLNKYNNIE